MKKTIFAFLTAASLIAFPVMSATFPGANALACDASKFVPIYGKDGVTILYWNNPTCKPNNGFSQTKLVATPGPDGVLGTPDDGSKTVNDD